MSTTTTTIKKDRVYVGPRSIGFVRRNRALEGVGMIGRKWVAEDRNHKRIPGIFDTATAAAHALGLYTGFTTTTTEEN